MENIIREKVKTFIRKCKNLQKEAVSEKGIVKDEYQNVIVDRFIELFKELESEISTEELGICIDKEKENIKKYYIAYYVLDEMIYKQLNSNIADNPSWKSEAIIRLHMIYLKCFREILFLLANGFSDCALARTRTLYETGVYISIINRNSEEIAERFCKYCNVQALVLSRVMHLDEKKKNLEKYIDEFHYEDAYKKEYGWARKLFSNIKTNSNIKFKKIVKLTPYLEYYNMYKISCNYVHGSLFSSLESLDNEKSTKTKNIWNTSPTNEGAEIVNLFLKIYINIFINEYAKKLKQNSFIEYMIMSWLLGWELLDSSYQKD